MIEQQIRPAQALPETLRQLLAAVRREDFVPQPLRHLAFADVEIPLGHDAAMFSPLLEARALEALAPSPQQKVLEVGAGSGYMAALLAQHARQVTTVEWVPELADLALKNLTAAGIGNVVVECGNGAQGWPAAGPYDLMLISAGLSSVPPAMLDQLNIGGRLFAVVGQPPVMHACLIARVAETEFHAHNLFETVLPLLKNGVVASRFRF